MAIQVNGTTVIDNSRNLSNVGGLKTVGGTAILGSGDIAVGGSTALGAVGTYILAADTGMDSSLGTQGYKAGRTASGSALLPRAAMGAIKNVFGNATSTSGTDIGKSAALPSGYYFGQGVTDNNTYAGSWRMMSPGANLMGQSSSAGWGGGMTALWVRYS